MSNLTPEWQAMSKLVSQFYAKADAGEDMMDRRLQRKLYGAVVVSFAFFAFEKCPATTDIVLTC